MSDWKSPAPVQVNCHCASTGNVYCVAPGSIRFMSIPCMAPTSVAVLPVTPESAPAPSAPVPIGVAAADQASAVVSLRASDSWRGTSAITSSVCAARCALRRPGNALLSTAPATMPRSAPSSAPANA